MNFTDINKLERELTFSLKEEYSFYQSLYVMLDKQRDALKYNKDNRLVELFAEIERCHKRIQKSEVKISEMKNKNPDLFNMVIVLPDVKKIINSMATLLKKNIKLVAECEEYMTGKYEKIKREIDKLKNSEKILQYITEAPASPQFVDGKK